MCVYVPVSEHCVTKSETDASGSENQYSIFRNPKIDHPFGLAELWTSAWRLKINSFELSSAQRGLFYWNTAVLQSSALHQNGSDKSLPQNLFKSRENLFLAHSILLCINIYFFVEVFHLSNGFANDVFWTKVGLPRGVHLSSGSSTKLRIYNLLRKWVKCTVTATHRNKL